MIPSEIPKHLRCSQEWNDAVMELARTLGSYAIAATQTDEWNGWFGNVRVKYRTCGVEWGYDPRYKILVVREEQCKVSLANKSVWLFDNFGISAGQVRARIEELKNNA